MAAPEARPDFRRDIEPPNYALDLTEANISGMLWLDPKFTAIGGVCIARAHVGKDCRGRGSVIGVEEGAFNARGATIDGEVVLRPVDTVDGTVLPFISEGDIDFSNSTVGGDFAMMGAELTGGFSARYSKIGANLYFLTWRRHRSPTSMSVSRVPRQAIGRSGVQPGSALQTTSRTV